MSSARSILTAFIAERRELAFQWGVRDCCLTAADFYLALHGEDFAAGLRGYSTRFGALRALRRAGFSAVRDVLQGRLQPASRAACGVIVMAPGAPLDTLLIADSALTCWGQDSHGLVRLAIPADAVLWEA